MTPRSSNSAFCIFDHSSQAFDPAPTFGLTRNLTRVRMRAPKQPTVTTSSSLDGRGVAFDAALDAIIVIDRDGRVVAFNAAAERTFEVPRATACGAFLADLIIPPRFRQAHRDGLRRYLATGETLIIGRRVELPALRGDGTEFPVELAIVRAPNVDPPLFIGYIRDLTDKRHDEAERADLLVRAQEARLEAERANRAKDDFLAIVSHELRTPLNSMLGWAVLLKSGGLGDDKRARALEVIERGARALAQIVDDLIDLSRIGRGGFTLGCTPIDAAVAVRAAIDMVQPAAHERGATIVAEGLGRPAPIRADRARVQQIVWNLVTNAVKFTPPDGTVTVRLAQRDREIDIVVEDSGAGIAREFLPHLFERFRQGEAGARQQGGLGLGLAIVSSLVELHGGTIKAESAAPGTRSRFTVTLPRAAPATADAAVHRAQL